jgi:hypothetical protein
MLMTYQRDDQKQSVESTTKYDKLGWNKKNE